MATPVKTLVDEQTAIRRRLHANGYRPLPAREKQVLLHGWPTIPVTERVIADWGNNRAFLTTAIQITGDLVALDFDLDDPMVDDLLDWAEAAVPGLMLAPIRAGKGHKVMYLARVDEPFGTIMSSTYCRGGDPEDRHRFEAFSGLTARYFSCFGPHTLGPRTAEGQEIAIAYRWNGGSPLELRVQDLPVIRKLDVLRIADRAAGMMEQAGWTRATRSRSGEVSEEVAYDITPDTRFWCHDRVSRSYEELASYAATEGGNARCSAGWTDPGATNTTRCHIKVDDDGVVYVIDYAELVRHYPEGHQRRTGAEREAADSRSTLERLGKLLRGVTPPKEPGEPQEPAEPDEHDAFEAAVTYAVTNYAFFPGGAAGEQVVPILNRAKPAMSLAAFKAMLAPMAVEQVGPRGGVTKVNPATVWLTSERLLTLDGFDFVPGTPEPVVETPDGRVVLNDYRPVVHDAPHRGLDVWLAFLEHLLPREAERAWFINWLAFKLQNPEQRGAGVAMVAPNVYGAGRGSLFAILSAVAGEAYCRRVSSDKLLSSAGQGVFNEWQMNSLFAFCDEVVVQEPGLTGRRKAYDRLKELIDPAATMVEVNVKYGRPRKVRSATSLVVASNHMSALPIDENDRRFAVLMNGRPLTENRALFERLALLRPGTRVDPGFAAAIHAWLLAQPTIEHDFWTPPATEWKSEMAELSEGFLEPLIREALDQNAEGLVCSTVLAARVEQLATTRGLPANIKAMTTYELRSRFAGDAGYHGWVRVGRLNIARNKDAAFYARVRGDGKVWAPDVARAHIEAMPTEARRVLG